MIISIIVCTYNRSYGISACLDSMAQALSAAAPVEGEIIVVDNASTDDTAAVIKKWAETSAFPVQMLYEPKKGVSAARNCGIRAARGELLVFTDDDCRLSKNHLIDALRYDAADTDPVLRGGRVELGDPTDLLLTVKTDPNPARQSRKMNSAKHEDIGTIVIGCNMAMRRAVADAIGFFDENLGPGTSIPAAEDTDFLLRAYQAYVVLEYVPDMTVYHFHGRKTKSEGYRLLQNYTLGRGAMYAKYLFKNMDLSRQFYWDLKDAVREVISGKNIYMHNVKDFHGIDFSYRDRIICNLRGAIKYCLMVAIKTVK